MTPEEIVSRLRSMLATAQELARLQDPSLQGDVQIILAILTDKLRHLDPGEYTPHPVDYE